MWPFPKSVNRWYDSALAEIETRARERLSLSYAAAAQKKTSKPAAAP